MSLEQKCLNSQTTKWNGIGTEMYELSDNQILSSLFCSRDENHVDVTAECGGIDFACQRGYFW